MSKSKTNYGLMREADVMVQRYAKHNDLEYERFSEYHTKMSSPNVVISMWTGSNRYYIEKTDYRKIKGVVERQGEKGRLPIGRDEMDKFFGLLFFAADMI